MRKGSLLPADPLRTRGSSPCLMRSREAEDIKSPPDYREPAPSRTGSREWFKSNRDHNIGTGVGEPVQNGTLCISLFTDWTLSRAQRHSISWTCSSRQPDQFPRLRLFAPARPE